MTNWESATQIRKLGGHRVQLTRASRILKTGMLAWLLWSNCACGTSNRPTVTPIQHSVALSWTASITIGVEYNIYRAAYTTTCGSFSKINDTPHAGTTYTDSNVVNDSAYCYGVKSVDSNNHESDYSNFVTNVHIPTQ